MKPKATAPVSSSSNSKIKLTIQDLASDKKPVKPPVVVPKKVEEKVTKIHSNQIKEEEKKEEPSTSASRASKLVLEPISSYTPEFERMREQVINDQTLRDKVKSISAKDSSTLEALGKALNAIAKTPLEKAWVIFYWLSQNIAYNIEGYFSGKLGDNSAEGVLKAKKSVCAGYAQLSENLGKSLGIEIKIIDGYSKGYGFSHGKKLTKPDHDWSAVKLDDNWYLMDSTWGTGHVDDTNKFKFQLVTQYFLARPEHFIWKHFPSDPKWQLFKNPITLSQFESAEAPGYLFYEHKLELISPHSGGVNMNDTFVVELKVPENIILMAKVLHYSLF